MTNLDQAWKKYLAEVEEGRQLFLDEPIVRENPLAEAAAYTLLHQRIALSYKPVMAPRQDFPVFLLQSYLDPYVYLGHLPCPDFVHRLGFLNGARRWRIWGNRNNCHWVDIQVQRGFWGEPGFTTLANYDFDDFIVAPDGSYEIIASPERPPDGNWIQLDPASGNNTLLV